MEKKSTEMFVILGYGVPDDIMKDGGYNCYLKLVFNTIYSLVVTNEIKNPILIFSGGNTDIRKPYKRIEALEMIRLFKYFSNRPFIRKITKSWRLLGEKRSLTTLENLLFVNKILQEIKIKNGTMYIFCEQTRQNKVETLAKKVFRQSGKVKVCPIDFDISNNRYLNPKFIKQKEDEDIKFGLWALKREENYKKYHNIFRERLQYFRRLGPSKHVQVIQKWWQKKLDDFIN